MRPPTPMPPSAAPSATAPAARTTTTPTPPGALPDLRADGWRQHWWGLAHVYTLTYPARACVRKQAEARDFFMRAGIPLIFCGECVTHYIRYISAHPPPVEGQRALAQWLIALHNDVNRRTGKASDWTYERVAEHYFGPQWRTILDVWNNQGNAACPPMPPVHGALPNTVKTSTDASYRRGRWTGLILGAAACACAVGIYVATGRYLNKASPPSPYLDPHGTP